MAATHPADLSVAQASALLDAGALSSVELTGACLERIAARDQAYGAWLNVYPEGALAAALASDGRRAIGRTRGKLDGVPVGLKDVIGAAGLPLTGDSAALAGNVARSDAGSWAQLRAAGAVLLGHLHCGEFACGTWGRNPWDESFSPGGSSSGSGVALAIRTVPATLGTDTRGSIRNPAAQNGVTGVKPTYGLVDARGIIPLAFSYDVVGPMARTAVDCTILMAALVGRSDLRWTDARAGVLTGLRIGVPRFPVPLSSGVGVVYERFLGELAELGASMIPIDRPANPLEEHGGRHGGFKTIIGAEAPAVHGQFERRRQLLRDEFRRDFPWLLDPGGTAADYVAAQRKRVALVQTWRSLFAEHELCALAEPCSTGEVWKREESVRDAQRPPRLYAMWSDTNFPVVCVPAGLSPVDQGPVGIQLIGLPYTEPLLLSIAASYQEGTGHHLAQPSGLDDPDRPAYRGPHRPDGGPQPPLETPLSPFEILHAGSR